MVERQQAFYLSKWKWRQDNMTKIKGLIEDISGAIRVTKKREEAFKNAKD